MTYAPKRRGLFQNKALFLKVLKVFFAKETYNFKAVSTASRLPKVWGLFYKKKLFLWDFLAQISYRFSFAQEVCQTI